MFSQITFVFHENVITGCLDPAFTTSFIRVWWVNKYFVTARFTDVPRASDDD